VANGVTSRDLFQRLSSVSAAISCLLGLEKAQATGAVGSTREWKASEDPDDFMPLVLKHAAPASMDELRFAGHSSHSSHASHASHASHYSGSQPAYRQPLPDGQDALPAVRPAPRAEAVQDLTPTPTPARAAPTPVRNAPATSLSSVEFRNGAILYGHVLVKSPAGITVETRGGKVYKVPRALLTDSTVAALRLDLP
jgi:hypothetical protein